MGVVGWGECLGGARRSTTGTISAIVLGSNPEVEGPGICVLDVVSLTTFTAWRPLEIPTVLSGVREKLVLDVPYIAGDLGDLGGTFGMFDALVGTELVRLTEELEVDDGFLTKSEGLERKRGSGVGVIGARFEEVGVALGARPAYGAKELVEEETAFDLPDGGAGFVVLA